MRTFAQHKLLQVGGAMHFTSGASAYNFKYTCRDGRSGSFWQSLARKLSFSLQRVLLVVRKTVPPTFNFTHSSLHFFEAKEEFPGGSITPTGWPALLACKRSRNTALDQDAINNSDHWAMGRPAWPWAWPASLVHAS